MVLSRAKHVSALNIIIRRNGRSTSTLIHERVEKMKSWKHVPGPRTLPIIGQMLEFLPGGSLYKFRGFSFWERLYKEYGPIVRIETAFTPPALILYDPQAVEIIQQNENFTPLRDTIGVLEYYKKCYTKDPQPLTGLVSENGDNWKRFRTLTNPVLMKPQAIARYNTVLTDVTNDLVKRLRNLNQNNKINENFDENISLWALESIVSVALGRRLNSLGEIHKLNSLERELINNVHDLFNAFNNLWHKPELWRYYPTKDYKQAMKACEGLEKILIHFINETIEEIKTKPKVHDEEKSILEKLLEINASVAVVMAQDMMMGGVDTTANALLATLYLLATNSDKQNKLREELKSNPDGRYLKACIQESMRVMPPVGLNSRTTTKEYELLGYKIPENMKMIFCEIYMSMMESEYPEPQEYIPERWVTGREEAISYRHAHRFGLRPFGFGARSCIGRRVAQLELETALTQLILNFHMDWKGPPPTLLPGVVNYIKGPFHFVFRDI